MTLEKDGWDHVPSGLHPDALAELRDQAFADGIAGIRCLLDLPSVATTAREVKRRLIDLGLLPGRAVAIQAIAFNKTATTNWKVAWHQDLMFPFARPVQAPGFDIPSRKQGVDYARPPLVVLRNLLAARLHLDPCGLDNGPLRVAPGTHLHGIMSSMDAASATAKSRTVECVARTGDLILMKPLTLHASSTATSPRNRRVLHFVFHSGEEVPEPWHRSI